MLSLTFFHRRSWWPLAFLILSRALQNFYVVLRKKNVSVVFISRSRSLSSFFSLSFAGLPPTFSFSVFLLLSIYFKFVDMTINLGLIL